MLPDRQIVSPPYADCKYACTALAWLEPWNVLLPRTEARYAQALAAVPPLLHVGCVRVSRVATENKKLPLLHDRLPRRTGREVV